MIEYRPAQLSDLEPLRIFLSEQGWAERVGDSPQFQALLIKTDRTIVALNGERIVGFARALCDGISNGYISMVAVASDQRRRGIGRGLVDRLMEGDTEGKITWVLRAGRGSSPFWERLGFTSSALAMERLRRT
jgi:ribosomal protein S18 acetylase RimI-like enzyme